MFSSLDRPHLALALALALALLAPALSLQIDSESDLSLSPRSGGFSYVGSTGFSSAHVSLFEFSASGKLLRTLPAPLAVNQLPYRCSFVSKLRIMCLYPYPGEYPFFVDFSSGSVENITQIPRGAFGLAVDVKNQAAALIQFSNATIWDLDPIVEKLTINFELSSISEASIDSDSQTLWIVDGFGVTSTVLRRFDSANGNPLSSVPIGVSVSSINAINREEAAVLLNSNGGQSLTLAVVSAASNTTKKIFEYPSTLFPVGSGVSAALNAQKTIHYVILKDGGLGKLVLVTTPLNGAEKPTITTLNGPVTAPMALHVKF